MNHQTNENSAVRALTNQDLYDRQMLLLKTFLEHGAISLEQYRHSAGELERKMRH